MTYKRNAYMRMVYLNRGTYTNFGAPNTHYVCVTNGTGMNITVKAASNFVHGDRLWFTVRNGNVAFSSFSFAGSDDIVDTSGGTTNAPYYTPRVQHPLKLIMANEWVYESGDTP
jgi:hypothetical protein